MKIIFLGVGEACDERFPNTSLLVVDAGVSLLLDCGFTGAHAFFKQVNSEQWQRTFNAVDKGQGQSFSEGCELLEAVYISHFHGDHFFGLPLLLLRFYEQGREKPLAIIGQPGIEALVRQAFSLAYPNLYAKLGFEITFIEVSPKQEIEIAHLGLSFAPTIHPQENLAVQIAGGTKKIFYSGDGAISFESKALAQGCDLVVHEAFSMTGLVPGHGSVQSCLELAQETRIPRLALVHMQRDQRLQYEDIRSQGGGVGRPGVEVLLPVPGTVCKV